MQVCLRKLADSGIPKQMKRYQMKKFLTYLAFGVLHLINFLCLTVPRSFLPHIGRLLGDIVYCLSIHRKALARANLSLALGEDKRKLARRVFQHLGMNLIEFLALPRFSREELSKFCILRGKEHLLEALKQGKGAILLSAHLGNWELIATALSLSNFQVISPARPQDEFEGYIKKIRERSGFKTLPVDEGLIPLLCHLKKGAIVGILSDQNILFGGVNVPFFGIPTSTPPGPAILALRSGAPVLPTFDVRIGKFHIIHIQPPLPLIRNGDFREDVIKNTAMFNKVIEEWVRRFPEQWLWLHNRWRL